MKQWIAILAILLVALAPVVYAEENNTQEADKGKTLREQAKEVRAEVKEQAREQRMKVAEIGNGLKTCKGRRTTDCDEKRNEAKVQAKDVLVNAAEDVTAMLTSAKEKILASAVSDKDALVADLDAQITAIANAKVQVDALTANSTKEDVKTAAKDLRTAVQEAKKSLKYGANKLVSSRLGGVLVIVEQLQTKLENRLTKLAEKGADVSSAGLDAFKVKIAKAKSLNAEAIALFDKSKTAAQGEKDNLMKQATNKLKESHKAMVEARDMLKNMLQKIKELESKPVEAKTAETNTSATPTEANTSAENTSVEANTSAQ